MNFCSGLNCFVFLLSFLSFSHASVDHTDQVFFSNGSFTMGSARRDLLSTGEYPQKEIKVRAFFIDKYPVTNKDFKIFKSEKPLFLTDAEIDGYSWVLRKHKNTNAIEESRLSHPDNEHWAAVRNASWFMPYGPGSDLEGMDNHPVVHVTHYDAIAFCSWAGKRLVSEFEWEFAARGGEKDLLLPWGNLQELYRSNLWQGRFPDMDFGKDGYDTLSPVNAYDRQNDYGMHDMMGNVWEWTSTLFTIPRVPRDPKNPLYTIRGGSFIDAYDGKANDPVRITMRKGLNPGYRAENVGFRCAYFHDPKNPTGKLRRARKPKIHRYEDTWEYKQNLAMHRTDEL